MSIGEEESSPTSLRGEPLGQDQIKHLEFLQAVIARLANNSFLVKSWALTLTGALLAFAAANASRPMAVTALTSLVAFWFLDGYFLQQERSFRKLYDEVRRAGSTVEPFSMNPGPYAGGGGWRRAAFSPTLSLFYGGLSLAHLTVLIAVLFG